MLKRHKIGFIGSGNLAQAIMKGLIDSGTILPEQIWASNRSEGKLNRVCESLKINAAKTNEEVIDTCDVIFLAVKPQDLSDMLEPISSSFHDGHLVISLAAGITIEKLEDLLPETRLARVMPNTPIIIRKGVIGYVLAENAESSDGLLSDLLLPLGTVIRCEEGEEFQALMVSCASGTGFVYELMIYWQEWLEEHGFAPEAAREMTVQTFLGASLMAENSSATPIQDLQDKVVSKKGVTAAGLQSIQELEIERALRYSFEKAVIRDNELGSK